MTASAPHSGDPQPAGPWSDAPSWSGDTFDEQTGDISPRATAAALAAGREVTSSDTTTGGPPEPTGDVTHHPTVALDRTTPRPTRPAGAPAPPPTPPRETQPSPAAAAPPPGAPTPGGDSPTPAPTAGPATATTPGPTTTTGPAPTTTTGPGPTEQDSTTTAASTSASGPDRPAATTGAGPAAGLDAEDGAAAPAGPGPADAAEPEPAAGAEPGGDPGAGRTVGAQAGRGTGAAPRAAAAGDDDGAADRLTGAWLGDGTGGVPDVMVLPEPGAGRDRTAAPVPNPRAEAGGPSFWLHAIERGEDLPEGELFHQAPGATATATRVRPVRRTAPRTPLRPALGLGALLALALVGSFFAWVSAEPLWLAVGHSTTGTATVTRCTGDGVGQRCRGTFTADGRTVPSVALLGVQPAQAQPGTRVTARMVSANSRQAFVGASGWTLHLRWLLGVLFVVGCGLGIASATGARRLENARARRRAVLLSNTAPLLVLAGFLVAAY
ncbi:hypothetical protein [Spirilliplanes yamanashiensis]|uniref:Uncharacterized protein n=1 Tax=Spirilliplanes yamanashiensis TaxID=42233 RepID=A0A8J3Y3I4_9ACTN|nr:hypothetical protein [Spirilliplanes yamanashiensis]MDP9814229.1 hypothetical protein [Spirilliplanes yamanashiensis]GIJ00789.1 hypothetical protein Sya03_01410 [Spirilliplanes yamanashiensis]